MNQGMFVSLSKLTSQIQKFGFDDTLECVSFVVRLEAARGNSTPGPAHNPPIKPQLYGLNKQDIACQLESFRAAAW